MATFPARSRLRTLIITALAIASAATALFVVLGAAWVIDGLVDRANRRELRGHYEALQATLVQEAQRAEAMAAVVAAMPQVAEAMQRGDRAALTAMFGTGFAGLKSAYGIEQFQFHLSPAISFLRVNQPEKYGDDLSSFRQTVVQANATHKPVLGLERGVTGLGIRGVVPVAQAGRHIGTVEFGLTFGGPFFEAFSRARHVDVVLHLIDRQGFSTFASTLGDQSFFAPTEYPAASSGDVIIREATHGTIPVAALLGTVRDFAGKPLGAVEIVMDNTEYAALLYRAALLTAAIAGLGLVVALLTGLLISRRITRPISDMTAAMLRLAEGDHNIVLPRSRIHEVNQMAAAMEVFRDTAIERRRDVEQKDVETRAQEAKRAALTRMAHVVETETTSALTEVARRTAAMAESAGAMSASAVRTGESAHAATEAASQTLAHVQTVAGAAEQLAASIREIAGQVGHSTAVVGRAVAAGEETRKAIEALNGEVAQIGAVAQMIADIAARTNLLALNATIEAARAGEAGRGFAVVAGEVKQLANQTARSTDEISRRIHDVRAATVTSVATVARIERTIDEIHGIAGSIAAAVEEQGAATTEISRSVHESALATDRMTARIAEVSAEAERTGRHATNVHDEAVATATAANGLRETVIRAVRTSSAEVDRRVLARIAVDLPAQLRLGSRAETSARVTDISPGGARIEPGDETIPNGAKGMLTLAGWAHPLPFVVHDSDAKRMRVGFILEAATAAKLQGLIDRLAPRLAA